VRLALWRLEVRRGAGERAQVRRQDLRPALDASRMRFDTASASRFIWSGKLEEEHGTQEAAAGGEPARTGRSAVRKRCHDVSILILAGVGWCLGVHPRAKRSMTIIRLPQQGHGRG
jgi:hypothetical protein